MSSCYIRYSLDVRYLYPLKLINISPFISIPIPVFFYLHNYNPAYEHLLMIPNHPQDQPFQAIPGNSQSHLFPLLPLEQSHQHQLNTSSSSSFYHPDLANITPYFNHNNAQFDPPINHSQNQDYHNMSDHSSQLQLQQLQQLQQQQQHQQQDIPLHKPKRQRVSRACDSCRKKKTKCDGKTPCTHCTTNAYHCLYTEPEPKPKIKKV